MVYDNHQKGKAMIPAVESRVFQVYESLGNVILAVNPVCCQELGTFLNEFDAEDISPQMKNLAVSLAACNPGQTANHQITRLFGSEQLYLSADGRHPVRIMDEKEVPAGSRRTGPNYLIVMDDDLREEVATILTEEAKDDNVWYALARLLFRPQQVSQLKHRNNNRRSRFAA